MGIGFFRLLLALTVVVTHTHPIFGFNFGNPVIAVRTFFIISGFYMAMILSEKYQSKKLFWKNRSLRIFPIYWAVLIGTILVGILAYFVNGGWGELAYIVKYYKEFSIFTSVSCIFSNLFIITRDIFMFAEFSPENGALFYKSGLLNPSVPAWYFLLVPQAWTLVLELMFYLLAPFILILRTHYIWLIFVASILLKYLLPVWSLRGPIWEYRFFPAELCYFIMGIFAYKFYIKVKMNEANFKIIGPLTAVFISLLFVFFDYLPVYLHLNVFVFEWLLYALFIVLIPIVFVYSKKNSLDRKIGELSYPVYISHILVNNVVNPLFFIPYIHNPNWQALFVFLCSVIFSIILIVFVQNPIDKIRARNSKREELRVQNMILEGETA